MWTTVDNYILRLPYQPLKPPRMAASEATDARRPPRRMRDLPIKCSPPPGDDGSASISPFRGTLQGIRRYRARAEVEVRVLAYTGGVAALATGLALWLCQSGHSLLAPWAVLPLAALAAAAEKRSVSLSGNLEVSIALLPPLFAAVAIGPLAAMVVAAGGMLGGFRPPYLRWAVYTSTSSITGALAGLAAGLAANATSSVPGSIVVATVAGALAAQAVDVVFTAVTLLIRGSASVFGFLRLSAPALPTSVLLYSAVVAPLAYAYLAPSRWTLLFFLLPALAAQRLWAMYP